MSDFRLVVSSTIFTAHPNFKNSVNLPFLNALLRLPRILVYAVYRGLHFAMWLLVVMLLLVIEEYLSVGLSQNSLLFYAS
jgi:hypothetical protein